MRKPGAALAALHDALVTVAQTDPAAARLLKLWRMGAAMDWFGTLPPSENEQARGLRELLAYEERYTR